MNLVHATLLFVYPWNNPEYYAIFFIDFCICDGSGDPHYYTPDGALIHFMGTCKYTLWNSTIPNDRCEFRVETKNERRYGNNDVAHYFQNKIWNTQYSDHNCRSLTLKICFDKQMVDAWKETEREKETRSQSYTEKVIEFK
jgi:hypothetical protein